MALDYSVPVECIGKVAFVSWDRAHKVSKRSKRKSQRRGYAGSGMGVLPLSVLSAVVHRFAD